jgi:hypothetical protein
MALLELSLVFQHEGDESVKARGHR